MKRCSRDRRKATRVANRLMDNNPLSILNYKSIQDRRKDRLRFWKENKFFKPMIKKERELIAFGRLVLKAMDRWLSSTQ